MSSESAAEIELLTQLQAGDRDALAKLFTQYRERLRNIVRFRLDDRLVGRISESDVLQDTYLCAAQRIQHYAETRPSLSFFMWLRLLVHQRLIELYRQHLGAEMRDVRKEVSLNGPMVSPHTSLLLANHLIADATSPSQAMARVEKLALLEEALNKMSSIDREMIVLRHFEELSSSETAQVLGIERAAASKRYFRAMRRLKQLLETIPELQDR